MVPSSGSVATRLRQMAPPEKLAKLAKPKLVCWILSMYQCMAWNGSGRAGFPVQTTLLAGSGGSGKGTLAAHLMACATNRKAWPDGTVSDPCTAVIVSPDDAASDTLKPRLHFSGVNFKRCLADEFEGGRFSQKVPRRWLGDH